MRSAAGQSRGGVQDPPPIGPIRSMDPAVYLEEMMALLMGAHADLNQGVFGFGKTQGPVKLEPGNRRTLVPKDLFGRGERPMGKRGRRNDALLPGLLPAGSAAERRTQLRF